MASKPELCRRESNKLEKRARLREAAELLFRRRGYEQTTTREIADAAGIATGTLFLYAHDKQDLLFLVMHEHLRVTVDEAFATLPRKAKLRGALRHLFSKHGGNLGSTGAVAWQFERRGLVLVAAEGADEEELLLAAADAGADDVSLDGSTFEVSSAPESLSSVREALEAAGFQPESAELAMVPKTTVAIEDESTARKVLRLVEGLEEADDVQDVYANFDIPESVLVSVAS